MPDTYIRNDRAVAGSLRSVVITQTVTAGDNTINHDKGKPVINFIVQDGDIFVDASGNIIDSDNFNINLAGGSITDAKITLIYEV